jgi:DNA-binding transcriptional MocR family regulator
MKKYEQLAKHIEQQILSHHYHQGEKLPSITQLSKEHHCSKATVIKCYEKLIEQHLIYVKSQSGYYVADGFLKTASSHERFTLDTGNPIVSATSLIDAKHCLSIAIEQYSESSLNISLQGVESLRHILPDFLSSLGIYAQEDSIYLIQGVTQMLSFLSSLEFDNHHQYILIEEPTYSYYVQFLKSMNIPVLTIQRDENGINLKELQQLFSKYDIKFFYTVPRNHNPLGTTLNTYTRQKIAELALKYNVYIIEDDYFAHCSYSPRYLPISYYMEGQNCIYLTSFSKIIPYIRIGICVIPTHFKTLFEKLIHQSYYYSYQLPSLISQATLESYLRSSLYQKQIKILQDQLSKDYQIIEKITQQWDPQIAYPLYDQSGYYLSLKINQTIQLDILQTNLLAQNIKIARNERCFYHQENFNHTLRLSLARIHPHDLEEALNLIYQTLLQYLIKNSTYNDY